MKKELNPAVIVGVLILVLAIIGGAFFWSVREKSPPDDATRSVDANGKKIRPRVAGAGGVKDTAPATGDKTDTSTPSK